ncbi:hypothetical protein [Wolbachia pipientis]|uniref:Uncharacterized protein n=1 Tax=Wolbachia pipientis TaxID=955 RepID=A0A7G5CBI9_WOLPI|nr:hypothetical protein [Wolbachia pipientis]QMV46573.1 hypothetical protein HC356_02690 [Wolbachia pipientis]
MFTYFMVIQTHFPSLFISLFHTLPSFTLFCSKSILFSGSQCLIPLSSQCMTLGSRNFYHALSW